jgi:hypothetical protein
MNLKEWIEIAADVATVCAIVVGGGWTYALFVRQRLRFPRAELEIVVDRAMLQADKRLLHAALKISNTGHVLLRPERAELRVRQVVPVAEEIAASFQTEIDPVPADRKEIEWPLLVQRQWSKEFEVEPGESDTLHADFVIDGNVEVIQLYGFVSNPAQKRPGFGWGVTKFICMSETMAMDNQDKGRSGGVVEKQQRRQQDQVPQQQQPQQAGGSQQQQGANTSGSKEPKR